MYRTANERKEVIEMKKNVRFFCLIFLLLLTASCTRKLEVEITDTTEITETTNTGNATGTIDASQTTDTANTTAQVDEFDYALYDNGDLQIEVNGQTTILQINALADSQIIEDEHQRILILTDPTDQYPHGILGDKIEASSVTIVHLSDQPAVVSHFSVAVDWVIESIRPIWSDWDGDGQREILLTLSNSTMGAKLVLYDEDGTLLGESLPIGIGNRWRQALDIAAFGESGQMLLVDVVTPHIGGIVNFYSWDKENKILKSEASISGYSTHDIGSRLMHMYTVVSDEATGQALLILPSQSKTELAALRFVSGEIQEEWRLPLGGRLSGNIELIDESGVRALRTLVDDNREVLLKLPE